MYMPSHFVEQRTEALHGLIAAHPLGSLVLVGPDGLDANHIPFLLDADTGPHGRLIAHVARANPLWQQARDGSPALVIFRAADAYISPNWYPSKHEQHRQVPTWNYQAVHVHGTIVVHDDVRFVRGVVARLTRTHEAATGAERPWKMTDATPEYIDSMLANIVGIEIPIARIEGKWKLSQNKETRDRMGAVQGLRDRGKDAAADAMLATLEPKA